MSYDYDVITIILHNAVNIVSITQLSRVFFDAILGKKYMKDWIFIVLMRNEMWIKCKYPQSHGLA